MANAYRRWHGGPCCARTSRTGCLCPEPLNLRLVQRLFSQVNRLVEINQLTSLTQDVVDTAREALIIGPR
jgi:hypothetical protein